MIGKKIVIALTATLLAAMALSVTAEGQIRGGKLFKNRYKKENEELRFQLDSLKKEMEQLRQDNLLKDSLTKEMLSIYEENEDKSAAGLNPEDYSPELTDSLLNIWYLHRQIQSDRIDEDYDMDSVHFTSNVSDAILKERLEGMNSFITLPYNETVRNYMVLYTEKMPTKIHS